MNSYDYVKRSRTNRKEKMLYVMGDFCQICGYDKCASALEFHHIDMTEKELAFNMAKNQSWEIVSNELRKCILVCANCHREIHAGLITQQLTSSFNEERALEITEQIDQVKHHEISYCQYCGTIVYKGNDCCPSCAAKLRRKADRPSREELKKAIRNLSFVQIAKQYGVTDNSIRKWCKSMNLPSKKSDINLYTDDEWVKI